LIKESRGKVSVGQKNVYATKAELIQAQIEYWTELRDKHVTENISDNLDTNTNEVLINTKLVDGCEHEGDGITEVRTDYIVLKRCKKCGDFFK